MYLSAPQPPNLGEQAIGFPQSWGTEGGVQQSGELTKYFASSVNLGAEVKFCGSTERLTLLEHASRVRAAAPVVGLPPQRS